MILDPECEGCLGSQGRIHQHPLSSTKGKGRGNSAYIKEFLCYNYVVQSGIHLILFVCFIRILDNLMLPSSGRKTDCREE